MPPKKRSNAMRTVQGGGVVDTFGRLLWEHIIKPAFTKAERDGREMYRRQGFRGMGKKKSANRKK